jgi:hypothetical protein
MNNSTLMTFKPATSSFISCMTTGLEKSWQYLSRCLFSKKNTFFHRNVLDNYNKLMYRLPYKIKYLKALKKKNWRSEIMVTYPDLPKSFHVLYQIAHVLGYSLTNKPASRAEFVINFEDSTFGRTDDTLRNLSKKYNVINYRCKDISKRNVDNIFEKVFGYSIAVDPTTYTGNAVKKSDINALHDGQVIQCPIDRIDEGYVYQKLINNQLDDEMNVQYRVPIFKNTIPFVFLKYRSITNRFGLMPPSNLKIEIAEVHEIFTQQEVDTILTFCQEIGLDLGDLDILRDKDDGRIYIVDANNTPSGPPDAIRKEEAEIALQRLALIFEKTFAKMDTKIQLSEEVVRSPRLHS